MCKHLVNDDEIIQKLRAEWAKHEQWKIQFSVESRFLNSSRNTSGDTPKLENMYDYVIK